MGGWTEWARQRDRADGTDEGRNAGGKKGRTAKRRWVRQAHHRQVAAVQKRASLRVTTGGEMARPAVAPYRSEYGTARRESRKGFAPPEAGKPPMRRAPRRGTRPTTARSAADERVFGEVGESAFASPELRRDRGVQFGVDGEVRAAGVVAV